MPKYFCDYCDTYLTHDSPSVRKTHNGGRKHKDQVRFYYERWLQEQTGLKVLPGMMPYQMPNQGKPLMPTPLMPPQGVPMRFATPPGGFGIPPGMPGFPGGPPGGPPGGMMPPRFPPPGAPPPMMPQQNITNMQPPSSS